MAAIPFVARPFLDLSIKGIDTLSTGAVVGSFAASLALFAPPVVLLGMVTPFAIRLAATGVEDAGRVAGRIFALSTAGSILGSFLPVLLLIPNIGTRRTFATLAISLLLVVLIGFLRTRRLWEGLLVLVALSLVAGLAFLPTGPLGIAIALAVNLRSPGPVGDLVLATTIAAAVVGEFLGPPALRRALRRAGELPA